MAMQVTERRMKGKGSIYKDKNGYYLYALMHEGERIVRSLKTKDPDEAEKNAIKVMREFGARIVSGELDTPSDKNLTIGELLTEYLEDIDIEEQKAANITRAVVGKIQKDKTFLPARKVAALTTRDFKEYRKRKTAAGASHATVNNHFALIRSAMNRATLQTPPRVKKVPHIPIVRVKNARKGFLAYEDHTSVLDALPRSLKALFVVAFHSGCRLGELLNMRWSDVDWKNRVIRLPETKNDEPRNLPFWGSIEEHLKAQKAYRDAHHPGCEHLFFWMAEDCKLAHGGVRTAPGTPIQDFRGSWANAVKAARAVNPNVKEDLLFHDLRRSGVRIMVQEAGLPESQAMLISGHKTRSMLERYNIVSLKNVQDAGAKLDAWSKTRKAG